MEASKINGDAKKAKLFAEESLRSDNVVLALDLDYTLAHYRNGLGELFSITEQFGVSRDHATKVLLETQARGFSLKAFHQNLSRLPQMVGKEDEFMGSANQWFRANYELYDDAHTFLGKYLERVPVIIVTAGDAEFQREKIDVLNFVPDQTIVVPMGTSKLDALKNISRHYGKLVVFVDDNPTEFAHIALDAWFGFPATSYSVRMVRKDGPYADTIRYPVLGNARTVRSFSQVLESFTKKGGLHEA